MGNTTAKGLFGKRLCYQSKTRRRKQSSIFANFNSFEITNNF